MAIRLVIADSSSIHCKLLADAMKRDRSIEVVGVVSSSQELLNLTSKIIFDIALLAPPLNDASPSTFEMLRALRLRVPHVRAIVMLDPSQNGDAIESLRAGARGIFSKQGTLEMLCKCIRRVHEGQIWAGHRELASFVDAVASSHRRLDPKKYNLLSKREKEVLLGVAEGLTNDEIGKQLGLSKHTVKNYMLSIFEKLGASNRVELLFLAIGQTAAASKDIEPSHPHSAPLIGENEQEE